MADLFVRSDVQSFLAGLKSVHGSKTQAITPEAMRTQYNILKHSVDVDPGALATEVDATIPGPGGDLVLRMYDARVTRGPGPALIFFHGGGFVIGDLDTHAALCGEIARVLDVPVIAVGYRLAPEHRWPAAPDDCEAATRWIARHQNFLGRKVTGIVVAGDSAGGALAIITAMALRDSPAEVPVMAQLCFYPVADMGKSYPSLESFGEGFFFTRASLEWSAEAYAADVKHMRASPMVSNLKGMPPAVVVTASLDPIRDQGRAYAAALVLAGVPTVFYEAAGNIHAFATLRKAVPSSQEDVTKALNALKGVMAEASV